MSASAIRIVSPAEFDPGTAQTAGSERRAAIAPALGIASAIWGGLFGMVLGQQAVDMAKRRFVPPAPTSIQRSLGQ